jgi:TatD DNase family protein
VTFCDAHNHLQFLPLCADLEAVVAAMRAAGISRCVVNGTSQEDWPAVADLARAYPDLVLPAFGLHPWFAAKRSPTWLAELTGMLEEFPSASVGECGLDFARATPTKSLQLEVFAAQLTLAAERGRPVSVHCVRAWAALLDILHHHPHAPPLLLHDFSGSPELVDQLARFRVIFSFSATPLSPPRAKVRAAFARVPAERLLLETDAPNNPAPAEIRSHTLSHAPAANHPANLAAVAASLATLRNLQPAELAALTARNFQQWFSLG